MYNIGFDTHAYTYVNFEIFDSNQIPLKQGAVFIKILYNPGNRF